MLVLLALILPAAATDTDPYQPAASLPTKLGSLQGEAPSLAQGGFSGGLAMGVGTNSLVRTFDDTRPDLTEVAMQVPLYFQGGYTVEGVARFDVMMPIYGLVDAPINAFSGAAGGDLRLQATVPLFSSDSVNVGIVPRLELPTGSKGALVTEGVTGTLIASAGNDLDLVGWVVNAGITLAKATQIEANAPSTGPSLKGLAAGWVHASPTMRVGAELDLASALVRGDGADVTNKVGMAHLFAQEVMENGFGLTAGFGTGTVAGIGTPGAHGYLSISYAKLTRDTDGDGIIDASDRCPKEPEDFDNFEDTDGCPDLDNDSDGVLDGADQCPMDAEDRDTYSDDDGCPDPDNDSDGILDTADACPMVAGIEALKGCPNTDTDGDGLNDSEDACPTEAGPAATKGCPDRDGDLVPDHRDACPDEPRPASEDPATSDGCPKIAYVEDGNVKITETVQFETGKSVLLAESDRILKAVAKVLTDTPQILRLEVQGHTDSVGSAPGNQRLSEARAEAVKTWLVEHGIPSRKLAAKGYGETKAIDSNMTEGGRAANRRVEFKILEMAAMPEPGGVGPVNPPTPFGGATEPGPSEMPAPPPPVEAQPEENPWGTRAPDLINPWGDIEEEVVPAPAPAAPSPASPAPEAPVSEGRRSKKR